MNNKVLLLIGVAIVLICPIIGCFNVLEGYSSDYNDIKSNELARQIEENKIEISWLKSQLNVAQNDARWETSPHFLRPRSYD